DAEATRRMDALLAEAEVYAGMRIPARLLSRAPKLKWLQVTQAGVDKVLLDREFRQSPVLLSNVGGIHSFAPAEMAIQFCLAWTKRTVECARQKEARLWEPFSPGVLRGRTMGIVGYGNIGQKVARIAKAFGMWVIATRKSATKPGKARYADLILPQSELQRLLKDSDFVVLATPLTPDTRHMMSTAQFDAMKNDALLVNVSRGPVVDEAALAVALGQKRIGGAALDVFEQEPLPQESPLWDLPNLLYSPHIAGYISAYPSMVQDLFVRNLERYVKGERPLTAVNKNRGY
ncbi:MAG: D-2-hydroxyacid dehydrogenase, partial [Dehalococcoidia bacterium]|nr:D-2-hydroxyacid dehydrogenase [Dehalococcoidia bacterium]